ncbi:MAG TPA: 7-carboxy-7-deazaguanine synthase QueE [Prochlorococcus sp.]|jgi:organic radical activating enzyme|nr:7-carboxy-7-deazaguanine synthase QueE [Prochlorococcaceae cyanobacterium ETNP2_MAG_10]MDP6196652.1 7-carboxy-7-deazaguanine synthase QueE [Prochlorococcaceae cyanobacterium ETNP18_MAG_17]MDP6321798.1 7-carboxy-7-deazaguanine synthase QueE [Prochlorococcaceae cyanobacterium ETNP14_MAG_5]
MTGNLPVVETFHSIQGEGAHAGRSAFFIRLAGCDVGCSWCDTKHSWISRNHPEIAIEQLAEETATAAKDGAAFVVLTGGEPLHHNLDNLCDAIRTATTSREAEPLPIHLETSGVNQLSGEPTWITLSPKRHAPPRTELLAACQELKVVVHETDDLNFAEDMAKAAIEARHNNDASHSRITNKAKQPLLFLQAGWDTTKGQQLAFDHVRRNPQWRLSMQTHKWLGIR